eukprot:11044085-Ditylum_brightwellii.AAC.1
MPHVLAYHQHTRKVPVLFKTGTHVLAFLFLVLTLENRLKMPGLGIGVCDAHINDDICLTLPKVPNNEVSIQGTIVFLVFLVDGGHWHFLPPSVLNAFLGFLTFGDKWIIAD